MRSSDRTPLPELQPPQEVTKFVFLIAAAAGDWNNVIQFEDYCRRCLTAILAPKRITLENFKPRFLESSFLRFSSTPGRGPERRTPGRQVGNSCLRLAKI